MQSKQFADGDRTNAALGKGLGIFSIGLGLAELVAPSRVAKLIGVDNFGIVSPTLRAFGVREIMTGLGLLAKPQSQLGPWARVVGDVLDLAFLSWAFKSKSMRKTRTFSAIAAVVGVAAVDAFAGVRRRRMMLGEPVRQAITIAREPDELYAFWRNFEQLPRFMTWVESVQDLGGGRSHWKVKTPAGGSIEYDAEIVEDVPRHRIAWRSLPGATVPNAGQVTFIAAPGGRGTEVLVEMQVAAPLGKTIASAEAKGDLRRLKQVLETGEILHSDSSIHRGPHPARPSEV
ncbi:MAG TPA: SRPBCC family protein [Kofleriaceae bacterium]